MTTARTELHGIVGWPVKHSISPQLHRAAFRVLGRDATYQAFEVVPDELEAALDGLAAVGVRGLNITVPHKEAVVELVARHTPEARALGAVNTLVLEEDGQWLGDNTDLPGLVRALQGDQVSVRGSHVVVLGAGGAARAAVAALGELGAARIDVLNRTRKRAERLVAALSSQVDSELWAGELTDPALGDATVVLQATSAGLDGRSCPIELPRCRPDAVAVDLVYRPAQTPFLREAKRHGMRVVGGLGMLVQQAALSQERWLGSRIGPEVVAAMERAAKQAMRVDRQFD